MLFHHILVLFGINVGLYMDGFFGSISQITALTEGSTLFVNLRCLLLYHKQEGKPLYSINGLFMCISFFVFRIIYYNYVIFTLWDEVIIKRDQSFWDTMYPDPTKAFMCKLSMVVYFVFYLLQLFWFSKILAGLLRVLGFEDLLFGNKNKIKKQ